MSENDEAEVERLRAEVERLQQRITELSVEGTWVDAPVLRLVQPSDGVIFGGRP